jgi:outer membrane immunogenic protein
MEDEIMKRVLLTSVGLAALAAFSSVASAADLRPAPYAAAPYAAPYYNWTGFYVGINGGGGWGNSTWTGANSFNTSGGLIGGTVGYMRQFGPLVAGIEGDLDWANIQGGGLCTFACQTTTNWLGTARGRVGYAFDRWLPYVTGGLAFGNFEAASNLGKSDTTNAGWTIGAGVEYGFVPNVSVKAEYLYVDLGNFSCNTCNIPVTNVDAHTNVVRAGVNVHF